MINTLPPISFNDADDSWPVIKWRILICEVDAHLVIFFIVPPELEWRSFCGDRPAESIQSVWRKLQGQELITEKAAARDFGKSFFKSGRSLPSPNVQLLMMVVSQSGTLLVVCP